MHFADAMVTRMTNFMTNMMANMMTNFMTNFMTNMKTNTIENMTYTMIIMTGSKGNVWKPWWPIHSGPGLLPWEIKSTLWRKSLSKITNIDTAFYKYFKGPCEKSQTPSTKKQYHTPLLSQTKLWNYYFRGHLQRSQVLWNICCCEYFSFAALKLFPSLKPVWKAEKSKWGRCQNQTMFLKTFLCHVFIIFVCYAVYFVGDINLHHLYYILLYFLSFLSQ